MEMLHRLKDRLQKFVGPNAVATTGGLTFEGSQIRLRSMTLQDVDALARFAMTPEVNEHVPHPTLTREDVARHVRESVQAHGMVPQIYYGFVIQKLDSGEVVGDCSLSHNAKERSAEVGYQIAPNHWKKGYATEATRCLLECARTLHCVKAWTRVYARNEASVRVLDKCGFTVAESYVEQLRQGEIRLYRMERLLTL